MFTGIIEEIGTIEEIKGSRNGARRFYVNCSLVLEDLKIGDSLAVNGVCLTVVEKNKSRISVEAVEETIKKTTLGSYKPGDFLNLERAVKVNDRLGGHIVQGHVDATGKVVSIEKLPLSRMFRFRMARSLMKYVIPMGSIAINGVSLTVAEKLSDSFRVAIIPHTFENTVFKFLRVGSEVNIEIDMIAKYIESIIKK
ncbi:MAG: riboflavin synthase [Bacteroidetes bacterium]|nr:riboflavin synthase [Bacteroidota bacterium]